MKFLKKLFKKIERKPQWGTEVEGYPDNAKEGDRFKGPHGWLYYMPEFGWLPYCCCAKCDELLVGYTKSMWGVCARCNLEERGIRINTNPKYKRKKK
jgi:hypothetical protein